MPHTRVEIRPGPEGPEVHKLTTGPLASDRTAGEVAWLRAAAGPGVCVVVASDPAVGHLVTRSAGAVTLAAAGRPPVEAAGILVAVADLLAGLHDRGLAHGAVEADHIVLDARNRPTLIAPATDRPREASDDVAGLGRCIAVLLSRWDELEIFVPDRVLWEETAERLQVTMEYGSARRARALLQRLSTPDRRGLPRLSLRRSG